MNTPVNKQMFLSGRRKSFSLIVHSIPHFSHMVGVLLWSSAGEGFSVKPTLSKSGVLLPPWHLAYCWCIRLWQLVLFLRKEESRIDLCLLKEKLLKAKDLTSVNTFLDHKFSYIFLAWEKRSLMNLRWRIGMQGGINIGFQLWICKTWSLFL